MSISIYICLICQNFAKLFGKKLFYKSHFYFKLILDACAAKHEDYNKVCNIPYHSPHIMLGEEDRLSPMLGF